MNDFFEATEAGDFSKVRSMLAANPSLVHEVDSRDRIPVSTRETMRKRNLGLAGEGAPQSARKLLPPLKRTALHIAALRRHTGIACLLIELGADINAADTTGMTPLHFAVRSLPNSAAVQLELAQLLMTSGADVNARSFESRTPLHCAFGWGVDPFPVIEILLANGADVNASDECGWTALDFAMFYSHSSDQTAVFRNLILHGADANANPPTSGQHGRLLYRAALVGQPEVTRILIEARADVNALSEGRGTALHAAAQSGHDKDVELLLAAGADPNGLDDENRTALDLIGAYIAMAAVLDRHVTESRRNVGT